MAGLPDAETSDQSWMKPEPPEKLPVAGYSEFNPPPVEKQSPERASAIRKLRMSFVWIAIGVALLVYVFLF